MASECVIIHVHVCSFSVPVPLVSAVGYTWVLRCAGHHVNTDSGLHSLENMTCSRAFVNDFTTTGKRERDRRRQRGGQRQREEEVKETVAVQIK